MPTIILSNKNEYECTFCGLSSVGILYIDIKGTDLTGALTEFSSQSNTEKIIYRTPLSDTLYEGFTKLLGVEYVIDGSTVRVSMRKPYTDEAEESQEVLQYKAALELLGIETGVN